MQAVNCNIVLCTWKISTNNNTSEACPMRKTNVVEKSPKYRIGREKEREKSPAGNDVI